MVPAAILRNCGTAVAICLLTVGVDAEHPIENLQLSCTGWRRAVEVLDPEVLAGWDERSDKRVGPLILPQVESGQRSKAATPVKTSATVV